MLYDLIIIGAGASGLSCSLVIGSGMKKPFAQEKKVALIAHQKASHLDNALFNNVLGSAPGTLGKDILESGIEQLSSHYPAIEHIKKEKVSHVHILDNHFSIETNKSTYKTKLAVIALNYSKPFTIDGLEDYLIPHQRTNVAKDRIQLKNEDHLVTDGLYVCGTLAGWRSQFSIAAGSGAQVATDILTLWNGGKHTKVHDKIQ